MIFIVDAGNRRLFQPDLDEMHRQRKAVFVDRIGWRLPTTKDAEIDSYDRVDTVYLLAKKRPQGPLLASVRLLRTTGPHLLSELLLPASQGAPLRGPHIWEVSRFCISPQVVGRRVRIALFAEVVCGVLETGLLFGLERVTLAANAALLPLVLRCGWRSAPIGPTLPDGADEVTAVAALIEPEGLRRVRMRFGAPAPITRYIDASWPAALDSTAYHRGASPQPPARIPTPIRTQ